MSEPAEEAPEAASAVSGAFPPPPFGFYESVIFKAPPRPITFCGIEPH